jgi:hypothetical protein
MTTAYRIPANACACTEPGKAPASTIPINRFSIRSFVTSLNDGATLAAGQEVALRGIAFDGGYGITDVTVSTDGRQNWTAAKLGQDLGRYSFRPWMLPIKLPKGTHEITVRAFNRIGQSQPMEPLWNPAGYMRNVVETLRVDAV